MNPLAMSEPDTHRPINERFLAYLKQLYAPRTRRHGVAVGGLAVGIACVVLGVLVAVLRREPVALAAIIIGAVQIVRAGMTLRRQDAQKKQFTRVCGVVKDGLFVNAYLVRAHEALLRPGTQTLPCTVLFSFQPEVDGDAPYMRHLAARVRRSEDDPEPGGERLYDDVPVLYRRRKLPLNLTDGSSIYCADLWVKRAYLKGGILKRNSLLCLAEPGDTGGIELIPAWLLTESEEQASLGISPASR